MFLGVLHKFGNPNIQIINALSNYSAKVMNLWPFFP